MQLSNIPGKLVLPWATSGNKNNIPVASQIGITAGAASLTDGFPPLTMTPVAAGGVPPSGLDMNGILYEMSTILRWANAGGGYAYDSTFANDSHVGGYPKGARVMRSDGMGYWFNTVDNNTTDPEAAGAAAAGWVPDYQAGATSVAMSGSSVTLTPAQYGKPLIVITGALSANLNLIFPALAQGWTIINNTTGGYSITAKTASGSGVTLGTISQIVGDGTNIYAANPDSVQIVTNVATLRNIAPTLSRRIQTRGYYTDGDGGSAQYFPKVGAAPGTYVDNGGTVIVPNGGDGSTAWIIDLAAPINVKQFGAKGDNVNNDTTPIQSAISYAQSLAVVTRVGVWIPHGQYKITGITVPSMIAVYGHGCLCPSGDGNVAITMQDCNYSIIRDISIYLTVQNQTALRVKGVSAYSQLNEFFGLKIDGELPPNTTGIELDNAFSNSFHGVNVLRVGTGVSFANGANANHFYGGEFRGNNLSANCGSPFVHGAACYSNGFHGTVIENWRNAGQMNGGVLTIDSGCYIEAFFSASCISLNDGTLKLIGNYLNNGFIFVNGGQMLSIKDNTFDGNLSNANYPFIQYRADVATRIDVKSNDVVNASGVLLRPREFYNGSAWAYRSIQNRLENIENKITRFQARLVADRADVTGDGAEYTIDFGANEQFDDGSNFLNTTLTFSENGLYQLEASVYLGGLSVADHNNIQVRIVTSNRAYTLAFVGADGVQTTSNQYIARGTAFVDAEVGDTAQVRVLVSGTAKVVDVLRGDAVNGYTTFSGFKVA